jgi:ABC-type multidrug transport system fused ATPase/permease subunit
MINALRKKWRSTTIGRSASVLTRADQRKVALVVVAQILLSVLDLIGVALIGVLGALAISGENAQREGSRILGLLTRLGIADNTLSFQATIIGLTAAGLLIGRSLMSVFFSRKTMFFLSRRGARISANLVSRLLNQNLLFIQARTSQSLLYSVTTGINTIVLGVLGTVISLISDSALLLVMALGLFAVDPTIALSTLLVFSSLVFVLYRLLHVRVRELGTKDAFFSIQVNEKIVEVLSSYRESVVRNRRVYYAREIGDLRMQQANISAELAFMPGISKYVIETTVILGALILGGAQFIFNDPIHAITTLSIFLAAGSRIAPAVLRLQQAALQIKGSLGSAGPTLDLLEELGTSYELDEISDHIDRDHSGFKAQIELQNVSFTYPNKKVPALDNISLTIAEGSTVAVVGSSGAGKTTLVDVILGVLNPQQGIVTISNRPPLVAIAKWSGALSYVPQDVSISNGTIQENVALGYPEASINESDIWRAIELAQLKDFVSELPQGLSTMTGEHGSRMSGGQRQRLGIARALFTNPKLLVLDEATSALDGQTEQAISESIATFKGKVTVLMIAHRLSTARNADLVIYMSGGKVISQGSFEAVRRAVPEFDAQARLMGL